MAPDVLGHVDYTYKCDIWSLGVIFYEILHGFPPWNAKTIKDLQKKQK